MKSAHHCCQSVGQAFARDKQDLAGWPGYLPVAAASKEPLLQMDGQRKVEAALSQKPDAPRTARFICALSLVWPDGHAESFEGQVAGTLVWPMRGENGFGYDPVFLPLGGDLTFGEMTPQAKHAISHRADAFAQLVAGCFGG